MGRLRISEVQLAQSLSVNDKLPLGKDDGRALTTNIQQLKDFITSDLNGKYNSTLTELNTIKANQETVNSNQNKQNAQLQNQINDIKKDLLKCVYNDSDVSNILQLYTTLNSLVVSQQETIGKHESDINNINNNKVSISNFQLEKNDFLNEISDLKLMVKELQDQIAYLNTELNIIKSNEENN